MVHDQGTCALQRGDYARARALARREPRAIPRARLRTQNVGGVLIDLGILALHEHRYRESVTLFVESLERVLTRGTARKRRRCRYEASPPRRRSEEISSRRPACSAQPRRSEEQTGGRAATRMRRSAFAEAMAPVVDRADEPEIAAAWAAGRAMSETDAAAFALATVAELAPRSSRQWRKWRRPVKIIAAPAAFTAAITSSSRFEPPGWIERGHARVERELRAVGEREERVAREHRAGRVVAELARLLERDPHRVDAAHLAGADPDRLQALREHDRVRAHVLAHAPGEQQVAPLLLADAAGDDASSAGGRRRRRRAPGRAGRRARACSRARPASPSRRSRSPEDPQRRLRAQRRRAPRRRSRARAAPRRTARRSARPSAAADRPVQHEHAAERRHRVGRERELVGLLDRARDRDAARVRRA